ncbi:ShlB/FhaC/HecB family hemolysin secretion/activation protein [Asaia prunellae]|uniref:ShlB/FhaC/HecB family hemolysin secretion/activation protein n=1 Tax=Asaia prunellae TaxID=610245 RepID=UPI00046E7E7A|nr:ShlB/FhaC/HecB family hemolysin secretion/activation protein [Asaia prunellae]
MRLLLSLVVFLALAPLGVQAHTILRPGMDEGEAALPARMAPAIKSPGLAPQPFGSSGQVLPLLRAIIIQPAGKTAAQTGSRVLSTEGLALLSSPDFTRLMMPFIGHSLNFGQMQTLINQVTGYYRTKGHAFVTVTVPPQRVHEGVLHLDVMEYRVGSIQVVGNRWFSARTIRNQSGLEAGQTLSLNTLQTDLSWLNTNPFRTVDMVYRPGRSPGLTNVDLRVADRLPLYVYGAYNNQLDPTLGRLNWDIGLSWGNAFNLGHILTYQLQRSVSGRFTGHNASWEIPLTSRDALLVYGSYSVSYPVADQPLTNKGVSGQASLRWLHMLPHLAVGPRLGIDGTVQAGFDWKSTISDQFSAAVPLILANAETNQFVLGFIGSVQDPWGKTEINNQIVYGPPGISAYNKRGWYETIFPNAKPNYVYDRLALNRAIALPGKFKANTKFSWQGATHNLLYSEQLMIGGMGTVRGYYVNTSFGSRALTFSEEITTPGFSLGKTLGIGQLEDTNTAGVFWDWGDNSQVHPAGIGRVW